MKTMLELANERDHAIKSMDDVVHKSKREDRDITKEETASLDELEKDVNALDKQITERENTEAYRTKVEKLLESRQKVADRIVPPIEPTNGEANADESDRRQIKVRPRYRSLRAFKGPDAEERAYESGMWCRAILYEDERAKRWCMNRGVELRAQKEGDNVYGGALVPDAFTQTIIDLRETYGVARRECRIVPMGSDHMLVPRVTSGLSATFVSEGAASSDTQAEWDNVALTPKKATVLVKVSNELAEDAVIDLADWLATDMARAFAQKEDECLFDGTGAQTYGGMRGLTDSSKLNNTALTGGVEAAATIDKFSEITSAELSGVMGTLPQYAHPGAKWFCSQACADVVFGRLMAAAGGNTMQTLSGAYQLSYMGYPIVVSQVMPTSTGSLDTEVMLMFGDMTMSTMFGDRRGFTLKVSQDRYMEYDQIGVMAAERFDINSHDIGTTSTAGPMISYIGNIA